MLLFVHLRGVFLSPSGAGQRRCSGRSFPAVLCPLPGAVLAGRGCIWYTAGKQDPIPYYIRSCFTCLSWIPSPTRRTYRRFEQKPVPQDVVDDIIEAVRLSSSGANRQAVRLVVVNQPTDVARVQPLVKWAAYLPPEQGTPKADELPTLFVAVVKDTAIPGDPATDIGIALANMTLAAWDKGVGSCIMGAINKPALTALLGIEEPQKLAFMVAFGYPTHKASIVPMTEQTGVKYYLDENRDYCVPKRSAEEIARSL